LYCSGCHHSTAESIETGARQHGVDAHGIDLLVRELRRACDAAATGDEDASRDLSAADRA
jgi:hypothetical protein